MSDTLRNARDAILDRCPVCYATEVCQHGFGTKSDGWKWAGAVKQGAPAAQRQRPGRRLEAQVMNKDALVARITAYLAGGGLFNPELAEHTAVRDLLMACRDALSPPKPVCLECMDPQKTPCRPGRCARGAGWGGPGVIQGGGPGLGPSMDAAS